MSERYDTHCPVCGNPEAVKRQEETIRYCRDCKFQWSTELGLELLLSLAVAHVRENTNAPLARGE